MNAVVTTLESLLRAEQIVRQACIATALVPALKSTTVDGTLPEAIAYPQTEAELCELMACAHRNSWRVLPLGQGSKLQWGGLAPGFDLAISTQRLNQITDHAVGDMTLTAEAGVKLADLTSQLPPHRQRLALDPAYPEQATLGGIVATGDAGSLRHRYNSLRDMLIGISFVRYDGQVAKAGGRVVKNVAGYDLMKLMTGAYGSLGIISQLTFRLYPTPPVSKTLVVSGASEAIGELTAKVRQSSLTPVALDLLSPPLAEQLHLPPSFALAAQFQSNAPGVEEQVKLFAEMASGLSALNTLEDSDEVQFWAKGRESLFPPFDYREDDTIPVIVKVGVPPAAAMTLLSTLEATLGRTGIARIHAGSGIGNLALSGTMATADTLKALRQACEAAGGYLTLLQAPKAVKQALDVWGYRGNALPLMARIKATFDPENLLNNGRFIGGL
jgi:glycolate oxidase FAD binding subunit